MTFGAQKGLGKHLGSNYLELGKTIKNTVMYFKTRGSEDEKSYKIKHKSTWKAFLKQKTVKMGLKYNCYLPKFVL